MLLHHHFIDTAKRLSAQPALIDTATNRRLSYQETLIASLILKKLFSPIDEQYIGIMLPTSAGCGLTLLATIFNGKIPVMINYSTGAAENCRFAKSECGFKTIVTSRILLEKIDCPPQEGMIYLEDLLIQVTKLDKLKTALLSKLPASILKKCVHQGELDDTVGIIFTSGSEKEPKGVELTHRSIGSNASAAYKHVGLREGHRILAILPMFHVFGFGTGFWLPITHGLTIISYPNPLEGKNIVKHIRNEKVAILFGTPFFIMNYMRLAETSDFDSVELIVCGADKTPEWLHAQMKKKFGIDICEGYGATETSPVISVNQATDNRLGSVGKPIPGVRVKIIDFNSGETLPPGKEGKILVKGDILMKGYFNNIEETALKIENGWYETGDMGVLDKDGFLWHRGRLKRFVKIGGEMISLVKTEAELEHILPEDCECCVVELPDSKKGATICAVTTQDIDTAKTKELLSKVLPPIAVPKVYLTIEELPKMGSGKIDFRKTTDLAKEQIESSVRA